MRRQQEEFTNLKERIQDYNSNLTHQIHNTLFIIGTKEEGEEE